MQHWVGSNAIGIAFTEASIESNERLTENASEQREANWTQLFYLFSQMIWVVWQQGAKITIVDTIARVLPILISMGFASFSFAALTNR